MINGHYLYKGEKIIGVECDNGSLYVGKEVLFKRVLRKFKDRDALIAEQEGIVADIEPLKGNGDGLFYGCIIHIEWKDPTNPFRIHQTDMRVFGSDAKAFTEQPENYLCWPCKGQYEVDLL